MELCAWLLFSISMSIFVLFQPGPSRDLVPQNASPYRLHGASWFGRQPEIHTFPEVQKLAPFVTPQAYIPPASRPVCPVSALSLASSPAFIETERPTITTAAPFVSETPLTAPRPEEHNEAWFEAALYAIDRIAQIFHSAASMLPGVKTLISVFIFMLCSGTLIGVVAATLFTAYAAYAACKRSTARFVQNVEPAITDIDRVAAEAERQMGFLRTSMQDINKEVGEVEKAVQSHAERVAERISEIDIQLELTSSRARGSLDAINHAVSEIQHQFLPFPTRDELLAEDLKVYRDSLAAARDEILEEAEEVKRLIPGFERKFQATVAGLMKDKLGKLPKVLADEKKRLWKAVKALREAHNAVPALGDLQNKAQQTRQEVLDMQSSLQKASAESTAALGQVPDLRNHLEAVQAEVLRLKEDTSSSRLTLTSVQEAFTTFVGKAEEMGAGVQAEVLRLKEDTSISRLVLANVEVAITAIAEKAEEVMAIAVSSDEEPSQPDQLTDLDEELLFLLDGDDEGASEESRDDQKDGPEADICPELERNMLYDDDGADEVLKAIEERKAEVALEHTARPGS